MIYDAVMTEYKVLCGMERMLQEDFTTKLMYYVDSEQMVQNDVLT
jgi:hypothetical protein